MTVAYERSTHVAGSDYDYLCQMIHKHTGLDLSSYKRHQMERRIRAMADRVNAGTLHEYWRLLAKDPTALQDFLRRLTINVSEFFRNPEKFQELRQHIFPELLRQHTRLSIWSAGCSFGAEPYSVAMILQQLSPGVSHRVVATDFDDAILERAATGIYTLDEVKSLPAALLQEYFSPTTGGYQIATKLRSSVTFKHHNLLHDACPDHLDLILCRNVLIYFSDGAKNRLFHQFFQALRPGGYLFIGSTERVVDATAIGFSSPCPFFYKKPNTR